jgi:hypothetical protein
MNILAGFGGQIAKGEQAIIAVAQRWGKSHRAKEVLSGIGAAIGATRKCWRKFRTEFPTPTQGTILRAAQEVHFAYAPALLASPREISAFFEFID